MKSIKVFLLTISVFYCVVICAQTMEIEWEKQLGTTNTDMFTDVIEDRNGGYTVTGAIFNEASKVLNNWLVRFDSEGNIIWTQSFGSESHSVPLHLTQFEDGSYILAGKIYQGNTTQGMLVKTDSLGKQRWEKRFPDMKCLGFDDVIVLENDNILAAGTIMDEDSLKSIWLVKVNMQGEITWEKTLKKMDVNIPKSLRKLPDGGYLLAAYVSEKNSLASNLYVIRFNARNELMWELHQKLTNTQVLPKCICCTPDNNIMVAGLYGTCMNDIHSENPVFDFDLFLTKISPDGKIVWNKNIDSEGSEGGNAVAVRPDGKILLAGRKETSFIGRIGPWILLADENGKILHEIVPPLLFNTDKADRVISTSDNGFVVIGPGEVDLNTSRSDGWIKKFKAF